MSVAHKVSDQHLHHESQENLLGIITSLETVTRTKNENIYNIIKGWQHAANKWGIH
jgi:hypothetical protein